MITRFQFILPVTFQQSFLTQTETGFARPSYRVGPGIKLRVWNRHFCSPSTANGGHPPFYIAATIAFRRFSSLKRLFIKIIFNCAAHKSRRFRTIKIKTRFQTIIQYPSDNFTVICKNLRHALIIASERCSLYAGDDMQYSPCSINCSKISCLKNSTHVEKVREIYLPHFIHIGTY